jgi:hypothetical protein
MNAKTANLKKNVPTAHGMSAVAGMQSILHKHLIRTVTGQFR